MDYLFHYIVLFCFLTEAKSGTCEALNKIRFEAAVAGASWSSCALLWWKVFSAFSP